MSIFVDERYRIKKNAEQEVQMKYLVQELKLFQSYAQILMISAVIGYNNNAYVPIEKQGEPVLMNFFTHENYDTIDLIAYARVKEQSILKDQKKYTIFESYANGGFPILVNTLGIDFINKNRNDRLAILRRYYTTLLLNGFII